MRSAWAALAAISLGLAVLGPSAAQTGAPAPLVRENATRKVSDHVWVIPDFSVPLVPNVGIIVGSRATLVVDTGLGTRNGETVMREVAKVSHNRTLYLASTHIHPEHDLGAFAFPPETRLIRSRDQVKDIAEFGPDMIRTFSARSPVVAELLKGAAYRKADILFDQTYDLDLGGVTVRFMAMGPNHTRGDVAMMVEPDRVLFAGDVAMTTLPMFASPYSNLAHWLTSLDRLEALKPTLIVPSHGPMGDVSMIPAWRDYLKAVQTRTVASKAQGRTPDETVAAVTAELQARYPDKGRIAPAVRAAYMEAP